MRGRGSPAGQGGFSILEVLIALAIVSILTVIASSTFRGLMEKYRVEGETKQFHADLMEARARAMQRNRIHFVRIATNGLGYATYDDTSPAPDGNGTFDGGADTVVASRTVGHQMTPSLPGVVWNFEFNRNGISSVTGDIRFSSTEKPDYDCITVRSTRIKMGVYNTGTVTCDEK
jgi:prepilin-type N-terminal cleavage/methylation domain-containing protein